MFQSAQAYLETDFKTRWEAGPDIEIAWENTPAPSPDVVTEWVRFVIQFGDASRMQIGGRGYRYWGIIMIQIFTEKGIGVNRGLVLADAAALLYRDQDFGGYMFDVPTIVKVPRGEKDWDHIQMSAPFYFNEVLP